MWSAGDAGGSQGCVEWLWAMLLPVSVCDASKDVKDEAAGLVLACKMPDLTQQQHASVPAYMIVESSTLHARTSAGCHVAPKPWMPCVHPNSRGKYMTGLQGWMSSMHCTLSMRPHRPPWMRKLLRRCPPLETQLLWPPLLLPPLQVMFALSLIVRLPTYISGVHLSESTL